MEQETETKINVNAIGEGMHTIHVVHGTLPDPINYETVKIEGNIFAVQNYIEGKDMRKIEGPPVVLQDSFLNSVVNHDTYIAINDENQTIELIVADADPRRTKVFGSLLKHDLFKKFNIETSVRITINSLKQLVRTMRPFFPDKEAHGKLLTNLGRTDMAVNTIIKEHNDDRGNINNILEQRVTSNVDERFTLEMPIYKGLPKYTFEVNVLFEVRDRGVSVWLESVEAIEIMRDVWDTLRDDQIKLFKERGFTVIVR